MQQNCANVGTYFLQKLATLRDEFPIVGDVRGKGLMIGVEMVVDKVSLFYLHHNQFCWICKFVSHFICSMLLVIFILWW